MLLQGLLQTNPNKRYLNTNKIFNRVNKEKWLLRQKRLESGTEGFSGGGWQDIGERIAIR